MADDNPPVPEQDGPAPPTPAAQALQERKRVIELYVLPVLTVVVLFAILICELTPDYSVWMDKLAKMDGNAWIGAIFVGVGDITSLFLIYSPLDTIFDVLIEGAVGDRLQELYVAALSNCIVWAIYGACGGKSVSFSVLIVNGAGFIFHAAYTIVMVRKSNSIALGLLRVVAGIAVALAITGAVAVGGCYLGISYGCHKAGIIGWSGALLTIGMYMAPAAQNFKNIQAMPLQMAMASTLNAAVWCAYGSTIGDVRMWFPNVIGVLISMVQLAFYYCRKPSVQGQDRELTQDEERLLGGGGAGGEE